MIKVTNPIEQMENATAEELVDLWNRSQVIIDGLKFSKYNQSRNDQFDAVIRVREWLMTVMQAKMTDEDFCKVINGKGKN